MAETLPQSDPHAPHRRWLARPRHIGRGIALSALVHAGIAVVVVVIWELIPAPPPRPVKITTLPHAPTREDLGLLPDGRLPPNWSADTASK